MLEAFNMFLQENSQIMEAKSISSSNKARFSFEFE